MWARTRLRQDVLWVAGFTLVLLTLRLGLVLAHDGYLGVDGGAYLLHTKRLLNQVDLPPIDFQRPILGPGWMLAPFILAWGDDIGYKVWDGIFSVIPFLPCAALLAFRILPRKLAYVSLIFLCLNPWHWEMVITGSLPIIGIGFICLCLWGLIGVLRGQPTIWDKLAIIGSIGIIPYINQTCTGLAAVALPVFMLGYCWVTNSLQPLRRVSPYVIIGALAALPAVILYYGDVGFNSSRVSFPGPKIFIPRGIHHGMMVAAYGLAIGIPCYRQAASRAIKALACVLIVHSILPIFYSYDEAIINIFFRSQHLVTPIMLMLGTWYVAQETQRLTRWKLHLGVTAMAGILIFASTFVFIRQATYSDMVTPDYDLARAHIPDKQSEKIITSNFMSGLWLAALEDTPTYWLFSAEPPPIWQDTYAEVQCIMGWRNGCDPIAAAQVINARWVLVDQRFPRVTAQEPNLWGAPEDTWAPTNEAPWLDLVFSKGTVRLWEIHSDAL